MNLKIKSTDMKLLLLQLCLLCLPGITFSDENGPVVVEEGSDVILPCSLSNKENIESKLFDWKKDGQKEVFLYDGGIHYNNGRSGQDEQFKGRVSHFQDELMYGNASIIIRNTKVADSGDYTCVFPRLQPQNQIFHIKLVVGAAAKPYLVIVDITEDKARLQCEIRGAAPKPKVEWQDSAGNILPAEETQVSERGGSYYITLQTNVTKTDRYRCVATQEDIKHQTHAKIYVPISGNNKREWISGFIFGVAIENAAIVVAVAVLFVLLARKCIKRRNKGPAPETKEHAPLNDLKRTF